ncbi:hypothetical protein ACHQM5_030315 [Ranunculus cassubicifolius]
MAKIILLHFTLLLLLSTLFTTISSLPSDTEPKSEEQFLQIIEALSGQGDFGNWARILSVADPSTFPLTATFFIPNDDSVSIFHQKSQFDPSNIGYHIVPQQLTLDDLLLLPTGSRIPTLLPDNSILVTRNDKLNFTIDDTNITHPNLYVGSAVSVHGIGSVLNYTLYGGEVFQDLNSSNPNTTTQVSKPNPNPIPPPSSPSSSTTTTPPSSTTPVGSAGHLPEPKAGGSQTFDYRRSDAAACLYVGTPVTLMTVVFAVFG